MAFTMMSATLRTAQPEALGQGDVWLTPIRGDSSSEPIALMVYEPRASQMKLYGMRLELSLEEARRLHMHLGRIIEWVAAEPIT